MNTSAVRRLEKSAPVVVCPGSGTQQQSLIKVMEQQFRRQQQPGSGNRKRKREKAFQHDAFVHIHIYKIYKHLMKKEKQQLHV